MARDYMAESDLLRHILVQLNALVFEDHELGCTGILFDRTLWNVSAADAALTRSILAEYGR